jgi:hypothetical protein
VRGYEPLIPAIEGLPDPGDRHVLAAAIKARAQVIVTANLKDFPSEALAPWSTEAKHPDAFVFDQIDLDHSRVYAAIQQIADSSTRPPLSVENILDRLSDKHGLIESAVALRR